MYVSVNSVRTMSLLATLLPPSFETKLYTKTINFTDLKKTRVAFPVKKSKKKLGTSFSTTRPLSLN